MGLKHHANLILGDKSSLVALNEFLEKEWGVNVLGNPDYYSFEFETLSIDDARKIKAIAGTKPFGEKKIIIIVTNFIGIEAQNALLKTLEEPSENTYFFIITPNENNLLETVRSRLSKFEIKNTQSKFDEIVKRFLKSDSDERLKILGEFLSHESETKKSDLISFLNEIEIKLSEKDIKDKNLQEGLRELLELKGYLSGRSPSVKMIGEYLALKLPFFQK